MIHLIVKLFMVFHLIFLQELNQLLNRCILFREENIMTDSQSLLQCIVVPKPAKYQSLRGKRRYSIYFTEIESVTC